MEIVWLIVVTFGVRLRLPRQFKKMLALQSTGDAHHDGELRRLFIDAHQSHVAYKKKVASGKVGTHDDGGDE